MRSVTAAFVLLAPVVILATDAVVWFLWGDHATITGVIRSWHRQSRWWEVAYITFVVLLYLHLFWDFPECFWGTSSGE